MTAATPDPGIYYDVPDAEYRAWDAFHKSAIPSLMRSPLHWKYEQDHPTQTVPMILGSLADAILFERDTMDERFVARPATYESEESHGRGENKVTETIIKPWNFNSKTCKAIYARLAESGRIIVGADTLAQAGEIADAVRAHPMMAEWLARGKFQVSLLWIDSETGVLCKARIDLLVEPDDWNNLGAADLLLADLKVTNDAAPNAFRRTMTNFGTHFQAGLYQDGYAVLRGGLSAPFYLVAAEMEPPHGVAVYPVGVASLATGLKRAREAMVVWKAMRESGTYPGYPVFEDELDVLPWALDKEIDFNV